MVLPTGAISMSQVNTEIGNPSTSPISLNTATIRALAAVPSGAISMNNLRGKSAGIQATGGSISYSGSYKIHTFTGPGTFSVTANTLGRSVEYLVVAGGGGGGGRGTYGGGGGGAGGVRTGSTPAPTGSYPVTIGAGGVGSSPRIPSDGPTPYPNPGTYSSTPGSPSSALSITSTGGGYGGNNSGTPPNSNNGGPGGSGGGARNYSGGTIKYYGGSGTSGQGNPGGSSNPPDGYSSSGSYTIESYAFGCGGGGAGGTGSFVSTVVPWPSNPVPSYYNSSGSGKGGNGIPSSISGSNTYYGGGGSGGSDTAHLTWPGAFSSGYKYIPNTAPLGGGGAGCVVTSRAPNYLPAQGSIPPSDLPSFTYDPRGAYVRVAGAGTQNRGGGGGGGYYGVITLDNPSNFFYAGGQPGGSGIVIIRYIQ